eukprot:7161836-Ditylum_brightwellii.AAC.1
MQRWLVERRKAQDRSEIDNRIIEFSDIVDNMVNSRFYLSLPPSFTMINGSKGNEATSFKQGTGSRNKRKGNDLQKGGEDKKRWINTSDQIEEFKMKEGEEWKANFCGKCAEA